MNALRAAVRAHDVDVIVANAVAFLGYLISHESHHGGEIEMTLILAGHKLDQQTSYGRWK